MKCEKKLRLSLYILLVKWFKIYFSRTSVTRITILWYFIVHVHPFMLFDKINVFRTVLNNNQSLEYMERSAPINSFFAFQYGLLIHGKLCQVRLELNILDTAILIVIVESERIIFHRIVYRFINKRRLQLISVKF